MVSPVLIEANGTKFIPTDVNNTDCQILFQRTQGTGSAVGVNIEKMGTGYFVPVGKKAIITHITILNGHDSTVLDNTRIWYSDGATNLTNAVYLIPAEITSIPPDFVFEFDCYWEVPAGKYINFTNGNNAAWQSGAHIYRFVEVDA